MNNRVDDSSKITVASGRTASDPLTIPCKNFISASNLVESEENISTQTSVDGVALKANFSPGINNTYTLGCNALRWNVIYYNNSSIGSSDETLKNIETLSDKEVSIFDSLKPVSYTWKDNPEKRHFGFGAQTVQKAFSKNGLNSSDYYIVDEGKILGLAYSEFIALNTHQIQQLKKRVAELEKRLGEYS